MAISTTITLDNAIQEIIHRIVKIANPDKIILFGSTVRHPSQQANDIDLIVVKSGITHRRQLAQQIYLGLHGILQSVDIIVETPDRLERYKEYPAFIYKSALAEGITIYGK